MLRDEKDERTSRLSKERRFKPRGYRAPSSSARNRTRGQRARTWSADIVRTYVHQVPDDKWPALLRCPRLLLLEQVKLAAKGEKVGEERVEVALGGQVEEDGVVRVVEVREDAEKLGVDVTRDRGEIWREFAAWSVRTRSEREGQRCCPEREAARVVRAPAFVGKTDSSLMSPSTQVST